MSCIVSTTPLFAGSCVVSEYPGFGIRGDQISAAGSDGPSPVFNDLSLPADAAKEYRWEFVSITSGWAAQLFENLTATITPPGGTVNATGALTYRLFEDGADIGVATETLQVGTGGSVSVLGSVGQATASGQAASLSIGTSIAGQIASASASGQSASISAAGLVVISGGIGASAASGLPASIITGTVLAAGPGAAQALGAGAQIVISTSILGAVGAALADGMPSAITVPSATLIQGNVGAGSAAGLQAGISVGGQVAQSTHWQYDVPAASLRFDVPSIGAGITIS